MSPQRQYLKVTKVTWLTYGRLWSPWRTTSSNRAKYRLISLRCSSSSCKTALIWTSNSPSKTVNATLWKTNWAQSMPSILRPRASPWHSKRTFLTCNRKSLMTRGDCRRRYCNYSNLWKRNVMQRTRQALRLNHWRRSLERLLARLKQPLVRTRVQIEDSRKNFGPSLPRKNDLRRSFRRFRIRA